MWGFGRTLFSPTRGNVEIKKDGGLVWNQLKRKSEHERLVTSFAGAVYIVYQIMIGRGAVNGRLSLFLFLVGLLKKELLNAMIGTRKQFIII
jgi:hypothetical protein